MSKDLQLPDDRVLVVGLGNPGAKYVGTRHNIGFDAVANLASLWGVSLSSQKWDAVLGEGLNGRRRVGLLLPQTFMNRSGQSVARAMTFWKLEPSALIVVHDDLDLEPGTIRVKLGGGHGGHNGLRSIDTLLGTNAYLRVRLGIGRPEHRGQVTSWVLGRFDDIDAADALRTNGAKAIDTLVQLGLREAQNQLHSR